MKWFKRLVLLVLILTACSQQQQALPPISISVDPGIKPSVDSLPGFEAGEPRPVATVTGEDGKKADFVSNEVWLSTNKEADLQSFLSRWQAKILKTLEPDKAGVTGLPKQYLIRITTSLADTKKLSEDLKTLDSKSTGDHKVSSQAGLELIAASSHEAAQGLAIGLNWVGSGDGQFSDRTSLEAPTGDKLAGVTYTKDAFGWPSHNSGSSSVQDIGVAEAWRALELSGKLSNKIKLAVLDMGFKPDADWPVGFQAISNVPFKDALGTENILSCGGGNSCPWHGTEVVSAAMAVPDNNYGSAGSAGPVADPIVVFTLYDFFTSIQALFDARVLGARIANMSYGAPVPWYLAWSVLPFEGATAGLRATGMLIFAAAGNDGENVDAEGCTLGVCWERTWYTPCENAGVICVGGLAGNSKSKASGSNYGGEQVDIFAPYTFWLGPDPSAPDNKARVLNGTSFSSPFTAGIAALIWAAKPSLGAGEVEDILMETAHPNADSRVKRHVNALAAVKKVLGNIAPSINLNTSGGNVPQNVELSLSADVFDFEDAFPCCTISWTSDKDGVLGTDRSVSHTFSSLGARTITVKATDSNGASSSASVSLNVVNFPPVVSLNSPKEGDSVFRGASVVLRGKATDLNEANNQLACTNLSWTSDLSTDPLPKTGCDVEVVFATNGARTLTLTAKDALGASDSRSIKLNVIDPPLNLPPNVHVTSPVDHASVRTDESLTLNATAIDPEGATPLAYEWTVQLFDNPPITVGTDLSVQWKPSDTFSFNGEGTYVIKVRLNVTDPEGHTGTDFITLEFLIIL